MLTKQLAIVQGPPGTGKTHVSVVAIETMHRNLQSGDPPIIVAAHTNHALDQLLRHIMKFEEKFIRLGGFTTDYENIKPRTLHEVKQSIKRPEIIGGASGPAHTKMRRYVISKLGRRSMQLFNIDCIPRMDWPPGVYRSSSTVVARLKLTVINVQACFRPCRTSQSTDKRRAFAVRDSCTVRCDYRSAT